MSLFDIFDCHFDSYRQYRPKYPAELYFLLKSECYSSRLAWDCGTGNGQAAVDLADCFDHVYATDRSFEQISRAIQHERVRYEVEPAERCGLSDASADLICVAEALHWFCNEAFFDEVRRVAVDGAVFAAWNYGACRVSHEMDRFLISLKHEKLGPYWSTNAVVDGKENLSLPWACTSVRLLMSEWWSINQFVGYIDSWSAVKAYSVIEGQHPMESVLEDLRSAWGNRQVQQVTWPLELLFCRVR